MFASTQEVVTDDPAVAAVAESQGVDRSTSLPATVGTMGATQAWLLALAQLTSEASADASSLRQLLRGASVELEAHPTPQAEPPAGLETEELRAKLKASQLAVRKVRKDADRWRRDYKKLRGRRIVKASLKLADIWARTRFVTRSRGLKAVQLVMSSPTQESGRAPLPPRGRSVEGSGTVTSEMDASTAPASLARILASVAPHELVLGPLVSILILTRDGADHLRRLLPALERTSYRPFEVIVVDNASGEESRRLLADWSPDFEVQVLRNEYNATFSAGNNQAAEAASGEYLLLLNDDVEPIDADWLGHLVATTRETGSGATGARLVYPPDTSKGTAGDPAAVALTLQHRGIHFENWGEGMPRARNLGVREDATSPAACAIREVPGVTAACLLVPRTVFEAVGGFSDGYDYGLEDVDLCLKLREAGHHIVVNGATALWHHEFGTQNRRGAEDKRQRRESNRQLFASRWGPKLHREVLRDRILGEGSWSESPLHVAITVTRLDESRAHGDWYSAHELGGALEALGWRVTYVERHQDHWYDMPRDVDVIVILLDAFDLGRLRHAPLTVAWVRNWTDRWVSRPWFDDYDIVLASSDVSARIIRAASTHEPVIFPLAGNPDRFSPDTATADETCDVVFVGSYWGEDRPVVQVLVALAKDYDVRLYGQGWDKVDEVAHVHCGVVPYSRLPSVLASARIVLDDTASPTKPYAAVNTRVFDGFASETFVLSDNPIGMGELFESDLPTWTDPQAAARQIQALLADDEHRTGLAQLARNEVLTRHTYAERATRFRRLLLDWVDAPRMDVYTSVTNRKTEHRWGDTHYARAVQRQLRRAGVTTRLVRQPQWGSINSATADAVLHLIGRPGMGPRAAQISLLWNISHPELITPEVCNSYDLVLVASDAFAMVLKERVEVPVHVVHQATDPERFRPIPTGPPHDLLFVGNSRHVRRRIIDDLLPTEFDIGLYGWGWTEDLVDLEHLRADHVPNATLNTYYAASAIVLNDHYDEMRDHGFVSNRLYDALAAGAFVISDPVEGLESLFDGAVVTYAGRDELQELVKRYLADPEARERLAATGRAAVLERHTFAHRVQQIFGLLDHRERSMVSGGELRWPGGVPRVNAIDTDAGLAARGEQNDSGPV
jgi:O-antigen biosynthesis protein